MDLDEKIQYIDRTDIYKCVKFDEAWLNLRRLLGHGGGMSSTESFFLFVIEIFKRVRDRQLAYPLLKVIVRV